MKTITAILLIIITASYAQAGELRTITCKEPTDSTSKKYLYVVEIKETKNLSEDILDLPIPDYYDYAYETEVTISRLSKKSNKSFVLRKFNTLSVGYDVQYSIDEVGFHFHVYLDELESADMTIANPYNRNLSDLEVDLDCEVK